jgi:hypothetical protein
MVLPFQAPPARSSTAAQSVAGDASASGLGTLGIRGFAFGDTIDLTGFAAVSRTFASNSLTLTDVDGTHATLAIQGSLATGGFIIRPDGSGGTDIAEQPFLVYAQTIDTAGIVATSETVAAGMMTLFNGGATAVGTIEVGTSLSTGDFSLQPDGSGGTDAIVHTAAGTYTSGVTLLVNPTTIGSLATIGDTVASGIGVNGPAGTYWAVTNLGQISETAPLSIGISLAAAGSIVNANGGRIAGTLDGVFLAAGGSVSNLSGGTIIGFTGGLRQYRPGHGLEYRQHPGRCHRRHRRQNRRGRYGHQPVRWIDNRPPRRRRHRRHRGEPWPH